MKITVIGYIEKNAFSYAQLSGVEKKLSALYQRFFGAKVTIKTVWMIVPKGQAYVAKNQTGIPTIATPVPNNTSKQIRTEFLYSVLDIWVSEAAVERHKIVISAADVSLLDRFMAVNRNRLSGFNKALYIVRFLSRLIYSKVFIGRFQSSVNF